MRSDSLRAGRQGADDVSQGWICPKCGCVYSLLVTDHGLRADLNPTRWVDANSTSWKRADDFWCQYFRHADAKVRARARAALGRHTQDQADA